jgi:hypothetical protein
MIFLGQTRLGFSLGPACLQSLCFYVPNSAGPEMISIIPWFHSPGHLYLHQCVCAWMFVNDGKLVLQP